MTLRCGSKPKCWKTMEKRVLRNSRRRLSSTFKMSSPSNFICPCVGSIRRVMHRTRVDLPEPERPITTNTSPGATSNETSRTAIVLPVFARKSVRESEASGEPITFSGLFPKTFHTFCTEIIGAAELMYSPRWDRRTIQNAQAYCWSKCV